MIEINDCPHTCRDNIVSVQRDNILSMQGCKTGPVDASDELDSGKAGCGAAKEAATPQNGDTTKPPTPALLHAPDSTVHSRGHARNTDAAVSGVAQAGVDSAGGQETDSQGTSHVLPTG